MGRPRKPTNILKLNGAFKRNPARGKARENEPVPPGGIGKAPDHLDDEHRVIWDEYVAASAPGVLTCSDRRAFELLVRLAHQMQYNYSNMPTGDKTQFRALSGQFGFTPSDRSKVAVPKQYVANPFDQL